MMSVCLQGVDSAFDEAETGLDQALADLQAYLKDVRRQLGAGAEVSYVSLNKDPFLLEVPEVRAGLGEGVRLSRESTGSPMHERHESSL